ncbi:MAG: hypothetical protein ACXW2D_15690 [Burkholderiaceae bacterium]
MEDGRLPQAELPPVIRSNQRAGPCAHDDPAWNPEFGSADSPILVDVDNVDRRVARHFDSSPDQAA